MPSSNIFPLKTIARQVAAANSTNSMKAVLDFLTKTGRILKSSNDFKRAQNVFFDYLDFVRKSGLSRQEAESLTHEKHKERGCDLDRIRSILHEYRSKLFDRYKEEPASVQKIIRQNLTGSILSKR